MAKKHKENKSQCRSREPITEEEDKQARVQSTSTTTTPKKELMNKSNPTIKLDQCMARCLTAKR
jgi:hypothetical protein